MKRKRKRKVWFYDEQVLMLSSSVYDDKWLTSTMILMNPSQRKSTPPEIHRWHHHHAWKIPAPWDTFLILFNLFVVGECWQVANCESANWPVTSSMHTFQFNLWFRVKMCQTNQSETREACKIYFVIKILKIRWMETMEKKMFPVSSSRRHEEINVISTILCVY